MWILFQVITDADQFEKLLASFSSAILPACRLPAQVFRAGYYNYRFLDFDLFSRSEFWVFLQLLMESSKDSKLDLLVLDPDPVQYFYRNFKQFGALEIAADAFSSQYYQLLETGMGSSRADAFLYKSEVLVWACPSLHWLIWAERSPGMMVLAYDNSFKAPGKDALRRSGLRSVTAEEALLFSVSGWRDRNERASFAQEFLTNYSHGQPWTDPVIHLVLDVTHKLIADEIGTVEACRSLSAIRPQIGGGLEDVLRIFTEIDRETNTLPIGTVRPEWEPSALALKDAELAPFEQLYRTRTIEACKLLIARLHITTR